MTFPDSFGWPAPTCMFPDWLNGVTWRDLEGRYSYALDDQGETLYGYHRRHMAPPNVAAAHAPPRDILSAFRCNQILDYYRLEDEFIILSFSTHHW